MHKLNKNRNKKYDNRCVAVKERQYFGLSKLTKLQGLWQAPRSTAMASAAMEYTHTSPEGGFEHVERTGHHGEPGQRQDQVGSSPPPRRTTTARPRPLSMPPVASAAPQASSEPSSHTRAPQEHRQQDYHVSRRGGSRPVVRVVGNYSLGKTVGAGSMGKVKIAYHNITGEKVSRDCPTRSNSRSYIGCLARD